MKENGILITAILTLFILLYIIASFFISNQKKKKCKNLIMDVKSYGVESWFQAAGFIMPLILGVKVLAECDRQLWYMLIPIMQLSIIVILVFEAGRKSRFLVYENAVIFPEGIIMWNEIIKHEWNEDRNEDLAVLTVFIQNKEGKIKRKRVKVMCVHKKEIEEIFELKVK